MILKIELTTDNQYLIITTMISFHLKPITNQELCQIFIILSGLDIKNLTGIILTMDKMSDLNTFTERNFMTDTGTFLPGLVRYILHWIFNNFNHYYCIDIYMEFIELNRLFFYILLFTIGGLINIWRNYAEKQKEDLELIILKNS